eukprot:PITA_30734
MERARSMLSGVGLGQEFSAEAVDTACYLVNRSPSSALEDKTPQEEAVDSEDGKLWKEAMVDEMASLHKNEAWDLVELLAGRKPIGNKWVFKKKTNAEGKVEKYKAWLVAKGYSQTRHCTCSGSIEQVYVKTKKGALDNSETGFMYLRGTSDYGLCYQGRPGLDRVLDIYGFVDVEWVGDLDQRRSTSGYVFNLFGGAVSWMSKKQSVVALSTTEAGYMETAHESKEAIWLQKLCSSMGLV